MGITVVNDGSHSTARIRGMARRSRNLMPVWPRVGRLLSSRARRQFNTRGAALGTPWKPLSPSYARRKRLAGFSSKPLVKTGVLRNEFVSRPMQTEIYRMRDADFGSRSELARWQSGGTTRNERRHIPARPILPVTQVLRDEVKDVLRKYIVGAARRKK